MEPNSRLNTSTLLRCGGMIETNSTASATVTAKNTPMTVSEASLVRSRTKAMPSATRMVNGTARVSGYCRMPVEPLKAATSAPRAMPPKEA